MKLATYKDGTRDGKLVVVSRDLTRAVAAQGIAPTMLAALERWAEVEPELVALSEDLNYRSVQDDFAFDAHATAAPLPRASAWLDGSAFLNHSRLMAVAFGSEISTDVPLMYQGASDDFYGARDDVVLPREEDGIDFEAELAIVVDDVPMAVSAARAVPHVKLLLLLNDVSLRVHGMREVKTGFGWIHGKPSSTFAPVAVTPDEVGTAWHTGRVDLPVQIRWNGEWFGHPSGGDMSYSFFELIEHAARTRRLRAGTVIGSGTVSSGDRTAGSACIAERRAIETIEGGAAVTQFMRFGDRVRIEVLAEDKGSIFGAIDQQIVQYRAPEFQG